MTQLALAASVLNNVGNDGMSGMTIVCITETVIPAPASTQMTRVSEAAASDGMDEESGDMALTIRPGTLGAITRDRAAFILTEPMRGVTLDTMAAGRYPAHARVRRSYPTHSRSVGNSGGHDHRNYLQNAQGGLGRRDGPALTE